MEGSWAGNGLDGGKMSARANIGAVFPREVRLGGDGLPRGDRGRELSHTAKLS